MYQSSWLTLALFQTTLGELITPFEHQVMLNGCLCLPSWCPLPPPIPEPWLSQWLWKSLRYGNQPIYGSLTEDRINGKNKVTAVNPSYHMQCRILTYLLKLLDTQRLCTNNDIASINSQYVHIKKDKELRKENLPSFRVQHPKKLMMLIC